MAVTSISLRSSWAKTLISNSDSKFSARLEAFKKKNMDAPKITIAIMMVRTEAILSQIFLRKELPTSRSMYLTELSPIFNSPHFFIPYNPSTFDDYDTLLHLFYDIPGMGSHNNCGTTAIDII